MLNVKTCINQKHPLKAEVKSDIVTSQEAVEEVEMMAMMVDPEKVMEGRGHINWLGCFGSG